MSSSARKGRLIESVLGAEEKRGRPSLAAWLANTQPNHLVKDPTCAAQYLILGRRKLLCLWLVVRPIGVLPVHKKCCSTIVYNTSTSGSRIYFFSRIKNLQHHHIKQIGI